MSALDIFKKSRSLSSANLNDIGKQDTKRFNLYKHYYKFYSGDHWDHERTDDEELVTANMCEALVDKHATFLAGNEWYLRDPDGDVDRDEFKFVNKVWEYSGKFSTFYDMAHGGSLFGDVFVMVGPDSDGEIKVHNVPPVYVYPTFHPDDKNRLLSAIVEYPVNSNIVTFVIDAQKIVRYVNGEKTREEFHGFGEPPIVHIANRPFPGTQFGKSDISSVIPLQKLYNSKMTDTSDTVSYHASPLTIGYGVRINQLERGAEKVISGLDKDARIENLEAKGDVLGGLEYAKQLKKLIHQLGNAPEIAFGAADELRFSNSSGLALQMLYQPMLDVLKVKYGYYGEGMRRINRLILMWGVRMLKVFAPQDEEAKTKFFNVEVGFKDPLPRDEMLELSRIITMLEKGLMTVEEAHQELGHKNIPEYIKKILGEVENGENLAYASANPDGDQASSSEEVTNIGGVVRDGGTMRQSKEQDDRAQQDKPDQSPEGN